MGPHPLPWGSSFIMKMVFLQSLQRPKWAASHVALSFSTLGLRTAQWSVTTAASIADMPMTITTDVILTFVTCSSNMLQLQVGAGRTVGVRVRPCHRFVSAGRVVGQAAVEFAPAPLYFQFLTSDIVSRCFAAFTTPPMSSVVAPALQGSVFFVLRLVPCGW